MICMREVMEVIVLIRKLVIKMSKTKGLPLCVLHHCNEKAFYFSFQLAKAKPSGAIHPTFLTGGWLKGSKGVWPFIFRALV